MPSYRIQMPDGTVTVVPAEQSADMIMAGGNVVGIEARPPAKAAVDTYGRKTTTDDPAAVGLTDPHAPRLAQIEGDYANSFGDEEGQAFMEGALRSVTAGIFANSPEEQMRAQVNPIASGGGEMAGLVGGALLGPVTAPGIAARAGTAAARGLASPVARIAIEGAVDGFTYATMRESAEALVHDRPFSAEAIAAETLAGAGIGAAIGVAAKGAGALSRALSKQDIAERSLAKMADDVDGDILLSSTSKIDDVKEPATRKAAREFFKSEHMGQVDRMSVSQWADTDALEDDLMRIGSDAPDMVRQEVLPLWADLQRKKRDFARKMGFQEVEAKASKVTGKTLEARYKPTDEFWRSKLSASSIQENARLIDDWEDILATADRLDQRFAAVREQGERWVFGPKTRDVSERLRDPGDPAAAKQFKEDYLKSMEGRTKTDQDEVISHILERESAIPSKSALTMRIANVPPGVSRAPADIIAGMKAGESPAIDELMNFSSSQVKEILRDPDISKDAINNLARQIRSHPEIAQFSPISKPLSKRDPLEHEFADIARQAAADSPRVRSYAKGSANPSYGPTPVDVVDGNVPKSGWGVVDMLRKTNMMGLMVAANFPGLILAKQIITRYGDKIAGAAEAVLSKPATRLLATKPVQLGFSRVLAPDGPDRDRDVRAILKASESPEAFDAAVDEAMLDVAEDAQGKRVEARAEITRQLEWMVGQLPRSLSRFSKDYSPSDVARYALISQAWARPLDVLAQGAAIPMVQLDAVEQLWPQTYSHFMVSVTEKLAEHAANGKPIPPGVSRIVPGVSISSTAEGQTILASMRPDETIKAGGGDASSSAGAIEPTTAVQSLSQNRIQLNR